MKDVEQVRPFVDQGCLLQVTGGSLLGEFGSRAKLAARELMNSNLVTLVASDGHNATVRKPALRAVHSWLAEYLDVQQADEMIVHVPRALAAVQFELPLPH